MSFELGFLDTSAGSLPHVRRGPATGPQLFVLQPLFEERNRLRRFLAETTRRLSEAGIGSWIVDLPGTGDSDLPSEYATWQGWRDALRAASQHIAANASTPYVLSVRGGCLLDDIDAEATYRFAPVSGERLLRDMLRTRFAGGMGDSMQSLQAAIESGETLTLAGYAIPAALAKALDLAEAQPIPVRTAMLGEGGDIALSGPPLWRQAEPVEAPELADALAADIASWIASCAAR